MKLFIITNDGVVDGLSLTEKFENELKNNQITVRLQRFNFVSMVSMITSQNELGKNNTQSDENEDRLRLKLNNFKYANVNVEQDMKMSKVTNHRILIRKAASLPVIYIFSRSGLKSRL